MHIHTCLMNSPLCFSQGVVHSTCSAASRFRPRRRWARHLLRRLFCRRVCRTFSKVWNCTVIRFTCWGGRGGGGGGKVSVILLKHSVFWSSPTTLSPPPFLEIRIWVSVSSFSLFHPPPPPTFCPPLQTKHLFRVRARELLVELLKLISALLNAWVRGGLDRPPPPLLHPAPNFSMLR